MSASILLARLLGPLFLLPGIGILVNPRAFRTVGNELVSSATFVYVFGLLDFAGGLAIVLFHNRWLAGWPVLITLIGWALLIRGAARVVAPGAVAGYAKTIVEKYSFFPFTGAAAVILGLVLCYFGYLA